MALNEDLTTMTVPGDALRIHCCCCFQHLSGLLGCLALCYTAAAGRCLGIFLAWLLAAVVLEEPSSAVSTLGTGAVLAGILLCSSMCSGVCRRSAGPAYSTLQDDVPDSKDGNTEMQEFEPAASSAPPLRSCLRAADKISPPPAPPPAAAQCPAASAASQLGSSPRSLPGHCPFAELEEPALGVDQTDTTVSPFLPPMAHNQVDDPGPVSTQVRRQGSQVRQRVTFELPLDEDVTQRCDILTALTATGVCPATLTSAAL